MVADPRGPIAASSLHKIADYIDSGRNLFLLCEPDRSSITRPLLDRLGLSLHEGMLLQPGDNNASDVVRSYLSDSAKNLSPQFARALKDNLTFYGDSFPRVIMAG